MSVGFETLLEDFAPNVSNLKVQHVALYFARSPGATIEFESTSDFNNQVVVL